MALQHDSRALTSTDAQVDDNLRFMSRLGSLYAITVWASVLLDIDEFATIPSDIAE